MRFSYLLTFCLLLSFGSFGQKTSIKSPNNKVEAALFSSSNTDLGSWYLKVNYSNGSQSFEAIPKIDLGLSRSDQDFSNELKFLKAGKPTLLSEQYTAIHGKRSNCSNQANEVVVSFENPSKAKMNLIIRAYNDGVTFRYEFPEKEGNFVMKDEYTAY